MKVELGVKLGVDSSSLTPLEVRMAAAKTAKESSARAKGSFATLVADSKVDESSLAGDAEKKWWQMSRIRKVELLRAWLIRRMRKRLQIRDLLLASRSR
ncbi:unnamed protein product [Prunus armeniaca]